MKEAYLYKKLDNDKVQCQTCEHRCLLKTGERGKCGVRENKDGTLYSLNYNKAISINVDPIEKKPLYHFLPGTRSLSVAAVGCQFACKNCQNWRISQGPKLNPEKEIPGEKITPNEIVEQAKDKNLKSISYTYTDPTVFLEYALDTMKLAHRQGIKNNWVTSGFFTKKAFDKIKPYLDAVNVDLKSFDSDYYEEYCDGRLQPVLDNLKRLKENNIWTEVTTLVIPGLTDDEESLQQIAQFIADELGTETPWHISRFSGAISWKLQDVKDTPVEKLKQAYKIGKDAGLKYVYVGNVPGLEQEDTFCSNCGAKMIDRSGFSSTCYDKEGECSKCGANLNLQLL
ncbi:MAG: AmmeMemoRadiSam system radical SAM enzyme [Candidatus Paceibacterota bacterium]